MISIDGISNVKVKTITYPDINNGIGCRLTIWVSGCTHKCPECHNAWLQDYSLGETFDKSLEDRIVDIFNQKKFLRGITLSGGDPLDQSPTNIIELFHSLQRIKERINRDIDIWCYTGYKFEELKENVKELLFDNVDVLVDGLYEKDKRNIMLPFRGSSNQRIIDIQKTKESNSIVIIEDSKFNS